MLLTPVEPAGCFDVSDADEKVQLGRRLWSGGYLESMTMLREANPALEPYMKENGLLVVKAD